MTPKQCLCLCYVLKQNKKIAKGDKSDKKGIILEDELK